MIARLLAWLRSSASDGDEAADTASTAADGSTGVADSTVTGGSTATDSSTVTGGSTATDSSTVTGGSTATDSSMVTGGSTAAADAEAADTDDDSESRFAGSLLDLSVIVGHGGGNAAAARELESVAEEADQLSEAHDN